MGDSRISLVSKRDIRYVGTLHEINSENSTVALEQVVSFGTEGRRAGEEVPASDNVYEYIVFRGSDVKDLRIEEPAPPKDNKAPQVPDDPAILGSARRPEPTSARQGSVPATSEKQATPQRTPPTSQPQPQQHVHNHGPIQQQHRQQPPPNFPHQPPFGYPYGPPPNQRFNPYGFPPGPGFPGMPYGAPPPWGYPPPGQGFQQPPPRSFFNQQMPNGPNGQPQQQGPPPQQTPPVGPATNQQMPTSVSQEPPNRPAATVNLPSTTTTPGPSATAANGPSPPTESKPDVAAALAPPATHVPQEPPSLTPQGAGAPRSGRIIPAVPRVSPAIKPVVPVNGTIQQPVTGAPTIQPAVPPVAPKPGPVASKTVELAHQDAVAAVQSAMAKIPPRKATTGDKAMENLTNKVNEMRTNDNIRSSKQPGTGGYAAGNRGGRGGRGGRAHGEQQTRIIEVPKTDYDFATANAKFNKQDLVKEAIATGSTLEDGQIAEDLTDKSAIDGASGHNSEPVIIPPGPGYNKKSSFFDNISSEAKERADDASGAKRLGGREFRSEEQKKNLETFGQGSVDNSYRGGLRGRGRGRGYGGRGRGYAGRGYAGRGGSVRGGRGAVATKS